MGEIADALRRAKLERERRREVGGAERARAQARNTASDGVTESAPSRGAGNRAPGRAQSLYLGTADDGAAPPPPISRSKKNGAWRSRAVLVDPQMAATQRFQQFALRIRRELQQRDLTTVLVTSALRGEGKTFTACNLALALASMPAEHRVALVDLDLRRPAICAALGAEPRLGLEHVLSGQAPLAEARTRTELPSLDLFLLERPVGNAHEILAEPVFAEVLAELGKRYGMVVLDTPPALLVPDALLILEHVGACVAVVRAGSTRLVALRDAFEMLPSEKVIGIFLNYAPAPRHAGQYDYYREEAERNPGAG